MSARRTTVWERKKAHVRPVGSPAAERIRARLRPSAITRITDRIFERYETLDSRLKAYEAGSTGWLAKSWLAIVFCSLLFVGFLYEGDPDHAAQFFGTIAVLAFAFRAYRDWHRRNPVSPPHVMTSRQEVAAVSHAVVAALVMFLAQWLIASSLQYPRLELFDTLLLSALAGAGVFRLRTTEAPEPQAKEYLGLTGLLVYVGIIYGFYALA